eukprot:6298941-Prorocentrum_lima.AAC.1
MLSTAQPVMAVLPRQQAPPAHQRRKQRAVSPVRELSQMHPVPARRPVLNATVRQVAAGETAGPLLPVDPALSGGPAPPRHAND